MTQSMVGDLAKENLTLRSKLATAGRLLSEARDRIEVLEQQLLAEEMHSDSLEAQLFS